MSGTTSFLNRYKIYFSLVLLPLVYPCFGQNTKIDSLQNQLKQTIPDTLRLKLLKQITAAYSSIDPQKKFYYANKTKDLADKLHNDIAVADAYISMGTSYFIRSKYDSALYYFTISYNRSEKAKYAIGMGKSLVNLGFTYDHLDDNREAVKHYAQALSIFNRLKFQKGIDQCNTNIGSIYYDNSQYKTAESYFSACLKSYTKSKDDAGIASASYSMGTCEQALGRDAEALNFFNKSMAIREKLGDLNGIALVHRGLGIVYMHQQQYQKAADNLLLGLKTVRNLQDKYEEAAILKILVENYVAMKQYALAEVNAKHALAISYALKSKSVSAIALRGLVLVYESKHDIKKAFEYQSKYVATEDSILADKEINDVTLTEIGRIRSENANLSKDNQDIATKNNNYQARIDHYSNVIVITSVFLVVVILLTLMLYHRNLEKQTTNKLLLQQKSEIADINHELETLNEEVTTQMELTNAQNAELERLNDIKNKFFSIISHDIRGPLNTLRSLFSVYRSGNITEDELRMLLARLEETILSTGSFLDNLLEWSKSQMEGIVINPVNLNIGDCIAENVHLFETQTEQKGIKVNNLANNEVMVHADQNMIRLVIRNLLSNSVKFCDRGDEITLSAIAKDGKALISVHDTGPGISNADREKLFSLEHIVSTGTQGEKGNHLGLILCRDMAVQNNGNIWLETQSGQGTTFWIELPLSV
jgi:signal transduction histidine kinase/uncharacterized protein HemY